MFIKGYKQTEEHRKKIGLALLGNKNGKNNKGRITSKETRQKISEIQRGKKMSEETKKKMSETHERIGTGKWMKGRKMSEYNKRKLMDVNWKGGISPKYRIKTASRPKPEQCEICGAMGRICFDHDHNNNKFRGWICVRCNLTLGLVKDNIEILLSLIEYIKKSKQ